MKLFRFNGGRIGIADKDQAWDISDALGIDVNAWPPVQMVALIKDFAERTRGITGHAKAKPIDLTAVRLDVPIEWPNKLLAFPANYRLHQLEMNSKNQANINGFFMKANTSLSGPNDPIVLPNLPGREIHHECEVGLVIGKQGRNIKRENAWEYIFGYACLIDAVIRGNEERVMRKSWDSFCPFGPWITTADEVPNPESLQAKLWVNGELRQNANTKDLILDIPGMIEMASRAATLLPGDIIATGTPEGVGPMKPGDKVRIAIEHLGEMNLDVVLEQPV
jgi:2-keto-4-pentenoate hydratase/2-oxohepta-3-ene-1,7-dioic acid hydratase in catechol pathway